MGFGAMEPGLFDVDFLEVNKSHLLSTFGPFTLAKCLTNPPTSTTCLHTKKKWGSTCSRVCEVHTPAIYIYIHGFYSMGFTMKASNLILLKEEILHHLTCMKPRKEWDMYRINWCRFFSTNSRNRFASRYPTIRDLQIQAAEHVTVFLVFEKWLNWVTGVAISSFKCSRT